MSSDEICPNFVGCSGGFRWEVDMILSPSPPKHPQRLTKRTNQDPKYGNVLWVFLSNAMLSGRETYRQAFATKKSGGTSSAGSIFMLLQSLIPRMDSPDAAIKKPPMSVTSVIRASVKYGAIVPANR